MKPRNLFTIVVLMMLGLAVTSINAQEKGGCDLCGPASGTNQNIATGNYSATLGASCEASGAFSFSAGYFAKANASSTLAIGKYVKAKATNAMVIGSGTSNADTKALINNIPNSLMIGFNSSAPTLFVSNSSGFNSTGKVGIGNITVPESKLHIKSDSNEDAGIILEPTSETQMAFLQMYDEKHQITVNKGKGMSFMSQDDKISFDASNIIMNSKLSINTSNRFAEGYEYALAVSGGILTTEVLVKEVTEWYDFVFDDNYKLKSIPELERYIDENGHLPDMPSESEVLNKGYGLVEMDGLLLKKIEELTLYTIELHKIIENQHKIIETLQNNQK